MNIVATKTKMGQMSFKCTAAKEWNILPKDIREIQSLSKFKEIVFKYFSEYDKSNHLFSYFSITFSIYIFVLLI